VGWPMGDARAVEISVSTSAHVGICVRVASTALADCSGDERVERPQFGDVAA
jgi:hypothetical protein